MPRPQRCRRICREPEYSGFLPDGIAGAEEVMLSVDEYETLRLVDYEKKTHEQCASQMDISRTTVTEIYESARYKVADCMVNGKRLRIAGGNYRMCDGLAARCCGKSCRQTDGIDNPVIRKGEHIMRIAVTYEEGQIFQHFGHTEQFKLYDVENGAVINEQVVDTMGSGHGALAGFLYGNKVDALICGGIGGGAQAALDDAGIKLYGGVSGNADAAVKALLNNTLGYDPDVHCNHHDNEHGGEAHVCGEHGCGEHDCH